MKKLKFFTFILLITVFAGIFTSANAQTSEISINLKDFDRLQIGNAFVIDVTKSSQFSIKAKGNKENLDGSEVSADHRQSALFSGGQRGHPEGFAEGPCALRIARGCQ